jgi:hypothetical protein
MGSGRQQHGRWTTGKGICAVARGIGLGGGWEVLMERMLMLRGVEKRRAGE